MSIQVCSELSGSRANLSVPLYKNYWSVAATFPLLSSLSFQLVTATYMPGGAVLIWNSTNCLAERVEVSALIAGTTQQVVIAITVRKVTIGT